MSDGQQIPDLIKSASNANLLQDAQRIAAKKLLDFDGEVFPSDGCDNLVDFAARSRNIGSRHIQGNRPRECSQK